MVYAYKVEGWREGARGVPRPLPKSWGLRACACVLASDGVESVKLRRYTFPENSLVNEQKGGIFSSIIIVCEPSIVVYMCP